MKKSDYICDSNGYTLIELVVVIALLAILLALGTPSLIQWVESARLKTLSSDLLSDLRLTRSEAILRGERVVLCTAASQESCSPSGGWHQGRLMFVDKNNNGSREASESIMRYRSAAPDGWSISGNSPVANYVSYDGLGATRLTGGAFQAGTVTVCRSGASNTNARKVVINSVGRPRSQTALVELCT